MCKLQQSCRQLITGSTIVALTIYFVFCREVYSTYYEAVRTIKYQELAHERFSDTISTVTLVVASVSSEDTTWIASNFPGITAAVYVVDKDDLSSSFITPINKGNEAMVYLTYIID